MEMVIVPKCCICDKELSRGSFNLKDKYELLAHAYICKECAEKIGIKSIWSAGRYTAEKAKNKYYEMFPDERINVKCEENVDIEHVKELRKAGRKKEAYEYIRDTAGTGQYGVEKIMKKADPIADNALFKKIKSIPYADMTMTIKEVIYLESIIEEGEEVLHTVSGLMSQNGINVSGNYRESAQRFNNSTRSWLLVLTDKRIIIINRHLLVGTEVIDLALEMINSISMQQRMLFSSIAIMHGSGGVIVDNIKKENAQEFVKKANRELQKKRNAHTDRIVEAINDISVSNISIADEIKKFKELYDMGAITHDEFEEQKAKLLKK